MTDHTRTTAKLASWGVVLTVVAIALGVAAAHHSAYLNAWEASGRPLVTLDEYGGEWPVTNWAPWVAWLAGLLLVAGVWCLVSVVWRVADRADGGPHATPPGALRRIATTAREDAVAADVAAEVDDEVEAYRAADRAPSSD